MNSHDPLDFLRPMGGVLEVDFAGRVPVFLGSRDLLIGDQSRDRFHVAHQFGMLPEPAGLGTGQTEDDA